MNNYNLTIATVNFMTPRYIDILVKSLHKQNAWWNDDILVYDNGPTKTTTPGKNDGFFAFHVPDTLYDEFNNMPVIDDPGWRNYASAKHAKTLQYIIDNTHTKYLMLLDTDIVFTDNFEPVFNMFSKYNFVVGGYIKEPVGYSKRLAPWCSFINVAKLNELELKYYDSSKILYVNGNLTDDTGASIYEECVNKNYPILRLPMDNSFYLHFKGGSYTDSKKVNAWIEKLKPYWESK